MMILMIAPRVMGDDYIDDDVDDDGDFEEEEATRIMIICTIRYEQSNIPN